MTEVPEIRAADFLEALRPVVDEALDRVLPPEAQGPCRLHSAMRYSVFAGGKRLRPALCVAAYSTFRSDWHPVVPVAAALELIHTYSLIHDDLPAMDDDDFRRGRPSCHRQFDEATAILAGDALLTLAFDCLAAADSFPYGLRSRIRQEARKRCRHGSSKPSPLDLNLLAHPPPCPR